MLKVTFGNVVMDSDISDIRRIFLFKDINNVKVSIMFKALNMSLGELGEQHTLKIEDTSTGFVLLEKPAELINIDFSLDNPDLPYSYRFKVL